MNFIPCLTWVAKGIAKSVPDKLQLSPDELKSLINETKELQRKIEDDAVSSSDKDEEIDDKKTTDQLEEECEEEEDFEKRYKLDSYDDDDGKDQPFMNISDVVTFVDNKEDNYIEEDVNDDEAEEEDFVIKENDNLLLVGHIEEESSVLEIHVYNKEEDALYVHHDIVLPAYPLALEWLDFSPSDEKPGNYVAVADMTPVIKIWDLDVVEVLEPDYCLGKELKKSKMKKMKYHTDAVISLCWNKNIRNLLASGSADSSIILWDLQEGRPLKKLEYHTDKVQSLQWHPFESSFLLSGCTDGVVTLFDCNIPDADAKSWTFSGEIEKVTWNLANPLKFLCSTDQGFVHSVDIKSNEIEHSYKAHTEAVTGLDVCPTHPNILVTASMDGTIKIWDLENLSHVQTKKLKVGSIYTVKFAPDRDLVLAIGGNDKSHCLKILDLEETVNSEKTEENIEQGNEKFNRKINYQNGEQTLKRKKFQSEDKSSLKKKPKKPSYNCNSNYESNFSIKSATSNSSSLKKKQKHIRNKQQT